MEKLNVARQFPYELFNIMRNERITSIPPGIIRKP